MSNFKTRSIGKMTPAVMLGQAQEIKWKGLILLGFTADGVFAYNSAGLNLFEHTFLIKRGDMLTMEKIHQTESTLEPGPETPTPADPVDSLDPDKID